jgi:hypothetical protein
MILKTFLLFPIIFQGIQLRSPFPPIQISTHPTVQTVQCTVSKNVQLQFFFPRFTMDLPCDFGKGLFFTQKIGGTWQSFLYKQLTACPLHVDIFF